VKKVSTAKEMQTADAYAINECGIPGIVLMENAGIRCVDTVLKNFPDCLQKKITIVAGKGNNGGDGFVIARHFFNKGGNVQVLLIGERDSLKNDARINANAAVNIGVPIKEINETNIKSCRHILNHSQLIIDAIFGTGFNKATSGIHKKVIEIINQTEKTVVSIDIPSGIDSDSGQFIGAKVNASVTIALALYKRSHWLFPSADAMGKLDLVDIGIPEKALNSVPIDINLLEVEDIQTQFQDRKVNSHKGTFGHALIVAGSLGKNGAGGLAALASLRSGAGLATLAMPESCQKIAGAIPLEVMTTGLSETKEGFLRSSAKLQILELCKDKSSIAIGPGISTEKETIELLENIIPELNIPLVLDADGLNCLALSQNLLSVLNPGTILTPHPKEMSRISGIETQEILNNRIAVSSEFAKKHSIYLILKGAHSIIALPSGEVFINPTGNSGMATAGSGDVLTGIIAGLLAQGMSSKWATLSGCYLHGLAGDQFVEKQSKTNLIAGDLLRELPNTIKSIFP
jgi:ADP-dependent NAD(P)H-hydrate dehydratase / NAD(P)H-hydrate epimerase